MSAHRPSSIQDVASAAGVSTATVSRVLNNADLVAPATAAKVQEAIRRLGYKPNPFAQGLMTRKSHVLGIALPDIHGEFYSELLRGADAEARRLGYHMLVSSEAHSRAEQERTGSLAFGFIDGLAVMIAEPNDDLWREARDSSLPLVVLDSDQRERGFDSVVVDNSTGTREATEHLLAFVKPERCFFVGGPKENFDTQQRGAAFQETLARAHWTARPDQIVHGRYSLAWGQMWGAEMTRTDKLKGAGVLAGNDEIALGILHMAQESGLRIPEELRIIGFDDTRLASLVRPALSTVRVPLAEVGAAAIRALVERIDEPDRAPRTVSLATKLIIRESSAAPKPT
jgi:LacI family transcriptional regulator